MNAPRNQKEPRRWGTPLRLFREHREKHGGPDGKGGCYVCYGKNRDDRHDRAHCEVNNWLKASATLALSSHQLTSGRHCEVQIRSRLTVFRLVRANTKF